MEDKTTYSINAFKYSLSALIIFIINFLWVAFTAKINAVLGGGISGIILIGFFVCNFIGFKNSYRAYTSKEPLTFFQKTVLIGNSILTLFVMIFILLIILGIAGVDIFGILSSKFN